MEVKGKGGETYIRTQLPLHFRVISVVNINALLLLVSFPGPGVGGGGMEVRE
jgi:hypothetical protein